MPDVWRGWRVQGQLGPDSQAGRRRFESGRPLSQNEVGQLFVRAALGLSAARFAWWQQRPNGDHAAGPFARVILICEYRRDKALRRNALRYWCVLRSVDSVSAECQLDQLDVSERLRRIGGIPGVEPTEGGTVAAGSQPPGASLRFRAKTSTPSSRVSRWRVCRGDATPFTPPCGIHIVVPWLERAPRRIARRVVATSIRSTSARASHDRRRLAVPTVRIGGVRPKTCRDPVTRPVAALSFRPRDNNRANGVRGGDRCSQEIMCAACD